MNKTKIYFCLFLFLMSFIYSKEILSFDIVNYIKNKDADINTNTNILETISNKKVSDPTSLLDIRNNDIEVKKINLDKVKMELDKKVNLTVENKEPIVYIYNTHQTEEYKTNSYNITPTVLTASNILKDELKKLNIFSFVETRDIIKEVKKRGYDYPGTYTVSFEYLKEREKQYPSIKYFFDVHRDSVTGNIARTKINGDSYATVMFLIGAKNKDYEKNLKNVKIMEKYLKENYPGLVRSTYIQKSSTFNQNYNQNMFLVELGGPDNTLEEVYNTTKALSKAIKYYIREDK